MTAFKNNSEMTLAVEGARGPPTTQKETFFHAPVPDTIISIAKTRLTYGGQK